MKKPTTAQGHKVEAAFLSLGQGLRVEEIAAASGLSESTVRAVLTHVPPSPRIPDYYEHEDRAMGWYYQPYHSAATGKRLPSVES